MRWKFERDNYEIYKCFMCLHVRTGTLILGLLHSVLYIGAIAFLTCSFIHPEWIQQLSFNNNNSSGRTSNLLLNSNNNYINSNNKMMINNVVDQSNKNPPLMMPLMQEMNHNSINNINNININNNNNSTQVTTIHYRYSKEFIFDNILILFFLSIGFLSLSLVLVYGTLTGVAQYITPFFCIQVFTLCLTGMTMLGYFSDIPNLKKWLTTIPDFPLKSKIMCLDNDQLTLLSVIFSVSILSIMMYCIGVVWGCYKYLKYREIFSGSDRIRNYNANPSANSLDDTEMLLPPKYEDVIRMSLEQTPPPAYHDEN